MTNLMLNRGLLSLAVSVAQKGFVKMAVSSALEQHKQGFDWAKESRSKFVTRAQDLANPSANAVIGVKKALAVRLFAPTNLMSGNPKQILKAIDMIAGLKSVTAAKWLDSLVKDENLDSEIRSYCVEELFKLLKYRFEKTEKIEAELSPLWREYSEFI